MRARVDELTAFADACRADGYTQVGVLGMGGSSLAPELFGRIFGPTGSATDAPAMPAAPASLAAPATLAPLATPQAREGMSLRVLDSTHPDAVREFREWATAARTLFIVSSKSGTTTEPLAFHAAMAAVAPSTDFIAITDPGTPLAELAQRDGFRHVFDAPADVGGRYSALTTFGLVPAVLAGVDIATLLDRAVEMAQRCRQPASNNPALRIAAALGEGVLGGRDKLTLMVTEKLVAFGDWLEQLIAESTGKLERGVVPVVGERVGEPASYGEDRYFVTMRLKAENQLVWDGYVRQLGTLGHPGHNVKLRDPYDIGAEFFRWEFATAALGIVLDIDPFDQPNVQESKDATTELLETYRSEGVLPQPEPMAVDEVAGGGMAAYAEAGSFGGSAADTPAVALTQLLAAIVPGDYFAILAYLPPTEPVRAALDDLRAAVRETLGVATTLGFGPRFLHSTGQLHKGGPASGVFLQLTADPKEDLPIPGWEESFGTLVAAQALGDLTSLQRRGRRALRVHLTDVERGLAELTQIVQQALKPPED